MRITLCVFALFILISCGGKKEVPAEQAPLQKEEETSKPTKKVGDFSFQPTKLKPVNESKSNPELRKVLNNLLSIINDKDVEGLKTYVDDNIKIGFGSEYGINDFIEQWELDLKPEQSLVWQELKNAIILGGTFDEDNTNSYYTPYVFTRFPDEFDEFEYATITGEKVNIRDKPSTNGKLVSQLSHDIVKVLQFDGNISKQSQRIGDQTHDWMKIEMSNGKKGYVWGKFCRMSVDYRAGFSKVRDEGWKLTFFLAGD